MTDALAVALGDLKGKIRNADLWIILGQSDPTRRTQKHNDELAAAMKELGWNGDKKLRFGGNPERGYNNTEEENPERIWVARDLPSPGNFTVSCGAVARKLTNWSVEEKRYEETVTLFDLQSEAMEGDGDVPGF